MHEAPLYLGGRDEPNNYNGCSILDKLPVDESPNKLKYRKGSRIIDRAHILDI